MRISVSHSTVYRYDRPVPLGPHVIRLRPRDDGAQTLQGFHLEINPRPVVCAESIDQDGNVVSQAWFAEPTPALDIRSRFTVETLRENPFDFLLTEGTTLKGGVMYPEPVRTVLSPYTGRTDAAQAVTEFVRSAAEAVDWKTIDFLLELNGRIHRQFHHVARAEGPARTAAETLEAGEGACRDMAVLFCSACRSLGLASRFVSGYEREAARNPDHAFMHAWAEVYLAGGGWRGFDPSQGLAVSTAHVAVAAALEPEMAAPISGTYRGEDHTIMETSIRMEVSDSQSG